MFPYLPCPIDAERGRKPIMRVMSFEMRSPQFGILHASWALTRSWSRNQQVLDVDPAQHVVRIDAPQLAC